MRLAKWTSAVASLSLVLGAAPVLADGESEAAQDGAVQEVDESTPSRQPMKGIEEITVTGSLVPRVQTDGPNSVDVVERFEIEQLGVQNSIDFIERLTYNSGSQSRSDAFRFGGGYGTAQVNLRGLGLGTTLVLLDGRRLAIAGVLAQDGSNFVDINSIPLATIERVEVLKEGAAATYGSDAVAGVVNFITRKNVEGVEFGTKYQRSRSGQVEQSYSGIAGWTSSDQRTHLQVHGEYFDSNQLNSTERGFTGVRRLANGDILDTARVAGNPTGISTGHSVLGGPGAFFIPTTSLRTGQPQNVQSILANASVDPNTPIVPGQPSLAQAAPAIGFTQAVGRIPVMDPNCRALGQSPFLQVNANSSLNGFCGYEFADNFNLNEHEQRARYNLLFTHDISETMSASFKLDYAYNKIDDVGNSPSFPVLSPIIVPQDNPGNFFDTDVLLLQSGRPLAEPIASQRAFYYTQNVRYEGGLKGEFDNGWTWDINTGYNTELRHANVADTRRIELQNAALGFGGSACPLLRGPDPSQPRALTLQNRDAAAAAAGVAPGVGPCQFFNFFGSALTIPDQTNARGQLLGNSQDVINSFTGRLKSDFTSALLYADGVITGELAELPAGPVGFALGYQYRRETFEIDRDADQTVDQTGINAVTGLQDARYLFLGGGSEIDEEQSVSAIFSELVIPATEKLEFQAAVRYEDYNGNIGSSVDPKIGFRFDAADWMTLRGSFSTTFRAPSLTQQNARNTAVVNLNSVTGSGFRAVDNAGSKDLSPEEADVYNFGMILSPFDGLNVTADYFRIDFEDIIVSQVAQNLIDLEENRNIQNGSIMVDGMRMLLNPDFCNSPDFQPLMLDNGRPVITRLENCSVARVEAQFVNQSAVITDGIDLNITYDTELVGLDRFRFFSNLTHLIQFDIKTDSGTVKAAASLNERAFPSSLPKWRWNTGVVGGLGDHTAGLTFRYISGYEDDRPFNGGGSANIGDHNEVDIFYAYELQQYNASFQAGIINLLDNEPPFVNLDFNFDPRVVDARGRRFYTNLTLRF